MFDHFPKSEIKIVAPDGTIRSIQQGIVSSTQVTIPNHTAMILAGDEIRRKLPNGIEETFEVLDPTYHEGIGGAIPPHYQVKIRRKGSFPAGTGGHFTFHVSGQNARVNIGSHDQSQNIIADNAIFGKLKNAFRTELPDSEERSRLLELIETMEGHANDRPRLLTAYQNFISAAANHMTVLAPFLPALTKLLG